MSAVSVRRGSTMMTFTVVGCLLFAPFEATKDDRVALGRIAADDEKGVGQLDIGVGGGRPV